MSVLTTFMVHSFQEVKQQTMLHHMLLIFNTYPVSLILYIIPE